MRTILIAAVASLFPLLLHGQCSPNRPLVTVSAIAYVEAPADVVQLHLSVCEAYSKSLAEQNLLANTRLETDLKFATNTGDRVDYFPEVVAREGGKYLVRKDVVVTLADRRTYRETLKKLLDLEYIQVKDCAFRLSQLEDYRSKALQQAMAKARAKAQLLARSMGQEIGAAYSISEAKYSEYTARFASDSLLRGRIVAFDSYPQHTGGINVAAEVTVSYDLK